MLDITLSRCKLHLNTLIEMPILKVSKNVMPDDVYKILIKEQAQEKLLRNRGQFGLQATAFLIIRKYNKGIKPNWLNEKSNEE